MARTLGIDFGTRRVGLALSDELGMLATPLDVLTIEDVGHAVNRACAVAKEKGVGRIVVGLPLNMNGTAGPAAEQSREFARLLGEKSGLPVDLFDERLTTCQVERALLQGDVSRDKRKKVRDKLCAQLILQSYLDAKGNQ